MMRKESEKRCLCCGKIILAGRSDRRYCDDVCRARATRQRNRERAADGYEDRHQAVISVLKRNYRLLKSAIGDREEWIVDLPTVYFKGFNRLFYTGSEPSDKGRTRYYCFEIGWEDLDDGRLMVSVNPDKLVIFDPADLGQGNFREDEPED